MAKRLGIASDLEERKWELEKEFKNTRNWKATNPFGTRKEAKDWLTKKSEEISCKTVADGKAPRRQKDPWFGFIFEHDGPIKT